jgi:hypothetical protein
VLLALVLLLPCYSYSNSITPYYGSTGNAVADSSLQWTMGNVFPSPPGLTVQNVIYSYNIRKATEDRVDVAVQNENALGQGYVFREVDSWLPGSLDNTQISKAVPVGNLPKELWGKGSIEVNGNGLVENANVIYTYKVDPCYNPQYDPNCPGYKQPVPEVVQVSYDVYDAGQDVDNSQYNPDDTVYEDDDLETKEDKERRESDEDLDSRERLEKALSVVGTNLLFTNAFAQSQVLESVNSATGIGTYYGVSIPGGVYKEEVSINDKQLPDSYKGLRNGLAQQVLHEKMISMQYGN